MVLSTVPPCAAEMLFAALNKNFIKKLQKILLIAQIFFEMSRKMV
jgi:hypothetical protein